MRPQPNDHFDNLSTSWTLFQEAHNPAGAPERRDSARVQLVLRYERVVRRYLTGALRREPNWQEAVEDCVSEFKLRMMDGSFKNANPQIGRFRDYLRTCLSRLVTDYYRGKGKQPEQLLVEPLVSEKENWEIWRLEYMTRALEALARYERETGQLLDTVLRLSLDHPDWTAEQIAEHCPPAADGRARTANWVGRRKYLARQRLHELLRNEIRLELNASTEEEVDEEWARVGLPTNR